MKPVTFARPGPFSGQVADPVRLRALRAADPNQGVYRMASCAWRRVCRTLTYRLGPMILRRLPQ